MTGPSQPTNPGSPSRGFAWKPVTITSIDKGVATVIDNLTKSFPVSITNMPAKGVAPKIGEKWIVHRMFGPWSFALCMNAPLSLQEADITNLVTDLAGANSASTAGLNALKQELYGSATRTTRPYVEVGLTVNVPITANHDTVAANSWVPLYDPDNYFTPSGTACFLTAPFVGKYCLRFEGCWAATATAGATAIKILLNGTSVGSNSKCTDTRPTSSVGEGSINKINEDVQLNAGDKLYFSVWTLNALTLQQFGLGPQTRFSMRWLGNQ